MTLTPGTKLGPYEILASIGAGGMGEGYRARDTRLDRTVAVQVLPRNLADNPDLRQRFEREARDRGLAARIPRHAVGTDGRVLNRLGDFACLAAEIRSLAVAARKGAPVFAEGYRAATGGSGTPDGDGPATRIVRREAVY
jgi:hypothetical protein